MKPQTRMKREAAREQLKASEAEQLAQAPEVIRLVGWFATAPANDKLIYHTGVICTDAEKDKLVARVRDLAWQAAEAGQLRLIQRRVGGARYAMSRSSGRVMNAIEICDPPATPAPIMSCSSK